MTSKRMPGVAVAARFVLTGVAHSRPNRFIPIDGSASWTAMILGIGAVGLGRRRRRSEIVPQS